MTIEYTAMNQTELISYIQWKERIWRPNINFGQVAQPLRAAVSLLVK